MLYIMFPGKPSVPMGPLEAKDIFADHLTLDWKPPEDDGGSDIDHYTVESLDTTTGMWVPSGRCKDTT